MGVLAVNRCEQCRYTVQIANEWYQRFASLVTQSIVFFLSVREQVIALLWFGISDYYYYYYYYYYFFLASQYTVAHSQNPPCMLNASHILSQKASHWGFKCLCIAILVHATLLEAYSGEGSHMAQC